MNARVSKTPPVWRQSDGKAQLGHLEEIHLRTYEQFIWLMLFADQEKMVYGMLKVLNLAENHHWNEGMAKGASATGAALDILNFHGLARGYHSRALERAESSGNLATRGLVTNLFGLHEAHTGDWDQALADGTFARAKKGALASEKPSAAKEVRL